MNENPKLRQLDLWLLIFVFGYHFHKIIFANAVGSFIPYNMSPICMYYEIPELFCLVVIFCKLIHILATAVLVPKECLNVENGKSKS